MAHAQQQDTVSFQQGHTDVRRGRTGLTAFMAISSKEPTTGRDSVAFGSLVPCRALLGDAIAGCLAARARLTPTDRRRKSEPDYRLGWNSYLEPAEVVVLKQQRLQAEQESAERQQLE